MPRILIDYANASFFRGEFTVDRAVGRNAPNDRLDVLLVQVLLMWGTGDNTKWPSLTVRSGLRGNPGIQGDNIEANSPKAARTDRARRHLRRPDHRFH